MDESNGKPDPATSPFRLALASWIHGGPAPKWQLSEQADVPPTFGPVSYLEVGCGRGENILPLAFYDRAGFYVGLDPKPQWVDLARDAAASLGLTNIRFDVLSSAAPSAEGTFDVVVVRDLLARVPEPVAHHLLARCVDVLAENGLVYTDYPVLPGAGQDALMRELLIGLAGEKGPAAERVERALSGTNALRALLGGPEQPYHRLLAAELEGLAQIPPTEVWSRYFLPSDGDGQRLAPRAFYHREVVEKAARAGLRYVCDAGWNKPGAYIPPALRGELTRLGMTGTALEQALDILGNKRSRASVFCRAEALPAEEPGPVVLDMLRITSSLRPVNNVPNLDPGAEEPFADAAGRKIGSSDPLLKASLLVLREEWPEPLTFAQLIGSAVAVLRSRGADGEPNDEQLAGVARDLWTLHARGFVELYPLAPTFQRGSAPKLHTLARHEGTFGSTLTTPFHTEFAPQGFDAAVVRRMAQDTNETTLIAGLVASILSGEVPLELGGVRLTDPTLVEPIARGLWSRSLATLGRLGLLEGS
ncbi:MAG: methyltransferase domain-containing protein [Polyangiaceae bacterium]|nr:methyltransferase domain-containing protein [Polyangiaceae bacterium]